MMRDVRFRQFSPEWVVLKQSSGEVLVVNDVGGRVLQVLHAGAATQGEVVESLAGEYEVQRSVLQADIAKFLHEMEQAQIIEGETA